MDTYYPFQQFLNFSKDKKQKATKRTVTTMTMMMVIQWTCRLGRSFCTSYLAGATVLGATQYSDGVLAVLLLKVVVLRLDAAEKKESNITLLGYDTL